MTKEHSSLIFSAKLDFISVETQHAGGIPPILGNPVWPRGFKGKLLTIHDPHPWDLVSLTKSLGDAKITEVEVSVDVRCAPEVPLELREEVLEGVIVNTFARGLMPKGRGLISGVRGGIDQKFGRLKPFNWGLPSPDQQLIYGTRHDPAQVKVYLKKKDNGEILHLENWRARVEVALRNEGLKSHKMDTLSGLMRCKLRKQLSGYFRHIQDATLRELDKQNIKPMQRVLSEARQAHKVDPEFARVGAGAVVGWGKLAGESLRLHAASKTNERIGQALGRLEKEIESWRNLDHRIVAQHNAKFLRGQPPTMQ